MSVNIGPRIGIDGEAEYRKQIQNIIQETKTLKSEMNALASSFDKDNKSLKQNRQQRKLLSEAISNQKAKLADLNNMHSMAAEKLGANATQTLKWKQAVADAETELHQMESELKDLPNGLSLVGEKMQEIGKSMQQVGKNLTTYVTLPLAALGIKGVKSFAEVDKTMVLTNKTMNSSAEEAKALSDAMKSAASNSTYSMNEAANATLNFARAGLDATEAANTLAPALNLAAGEGGDLDTVSAGLVATIKGFSGSFEDASHYADVFANACNNSALDVDALSNAMSVAAPVFSAAGYSVEDAALYLGAMADKGIDASVAANSLKTGMARLVEPMKSGAKWMDQLGISVTNADGSMKDTVTIQQELHEAFADLSESEQLAAASAIFGKNQMSSWLALINTAPEDVQRLSGAIQEDGTALEMSEAMMSGFGGSLEKLKASIDVATASLGEALAPTISLVAEKIQAAVDWFNSLDAEQQQTIATVGLLVAALGPILTIGGTLISGIGSIISVIGTVAGFVTATLIPAIGGLLTAIAPLLVAAAPFIAIGAAIVAAGVLIYKNWDKIKETAGKLWSAAKEKFGKIKDTITGAWDKVKTATTEKFESVKTTLSTTWSLIKTGASAALDNIKQAASDKLEKMKGIYEEKGGGIAGAAAVVWDAMTTAHQAAFDLMNNATGGKLGEMATKASEKIAEVKENILSGLNGAVEKVLGIGEDLVTGLWNGISNMASWISEKIHGFTDGVLNSLKDFFGIHSPSKETELIGKYLDEGLAAGIQKNQKAVDAAAEKVVQLLLGTYKKAIKYGVKDVLGEALVEQGKSQVKALRDSNKITLQEEIDFWKKLIKETKKGSKAYAQAQAELKKAKKSLTKSLNQLNKQYLKDVKAISKELKKSIKEINVKLAEDIAAEIESAQSDIDKVWENLSNQISQRASSLKLGLFDEVKTGDFVSGSTLLKRLRDQVLQLSKYESDLNRLKGRIGDSDLYREIAAMGTDALPEIQALNSMTDEELKQYIDYYNARDTITQRAAAEQLSREKAEAEAQVAEIEKASADRIAALKKAAEEEKATLISEAEKQVEALNEQYMKDLEALGVSLKTSGKNVGKQIIKGIAKGLKNTNIQSDISTAAKKIIKQIKDAFDIKSPSRVMREQVGKYLALGVAAGIEKYESVVADAMDAVTFAMSPLAYAGAPYAASSTTTSYGDNNITIYTQPGQDANEIADTVLSRLQNSYARQLRGAM